ncbi:uncharacterized protein, partial [Amphiura filiformis]|uniref:uncharacterized protein n=1 Tax=Amphiura filiformis TaxID=82378 RepID=UPI003B226EE7
TECAVPLGVESGVVRDGQITSGSEFYTDHPPHEARLHRANNWSTKEVNPSDPWIQVDFLDTVTITGLLTQGSAYDKHDEWVTMLQMQYGDTDNSLEFIMEGDVPKTFDANSDRNTVANITFPRSISGRFLRIIPIQWNEWITLRLEVIGCYEEPSEEPTTEEPTPEEPTTEAEENTPEEQTTKELTPQEPTTEEPTSQEPTTEEPTVEEPTTEGPTVEEPATEEPSVEEPTTEKPTPPEEPTPEEPTSAIIDVLPHPSTGGLSPEEIFGLVIGSLACIMLLIGIIVCSAKKKDGTIYPDELKKKKLKLVSSRIGGGKAGGSGGEVNNRAIVVS